jgi:uncharacterized membrane protein YdjX (TVP38/TMEM64 family)
MALGQSAVAMREGPRKVMGSQNRSAGGGLSLKGKRRYTLLCGRLFSILIILIMLSLVSRQRLNPNQLLNVIDDLGVLAPLGFIPFSALLVIIFLPPILSIMVGWLAFGAIWGAAYSVVGMTLGSCIAFLIGRFVIGEVDITLGQGKVGRTLQRVNEVIKDHGCLTVLGLKLLFFSNSALDYGVSRTEVRVKDYLLGTFCGIIPRTFVLSYLFEAVLRPALLAAEGMVVGAPLESVLYESLFGNGHLEHAFTWLVMLVCTRVCGVVLLGILAKRRQVPSVARS